MQEKSNYPCAWMNQLHYAKSMPLKSHTSEGKHHTIRIKGGAVHVMGIGISKIWIHQYYTPKFTKIQAFLAKTPFFVDYDNIYVNIVM